MFSRLKSPGRRFWTTRGAALAGIIVLHGGALALAMTRQGPQADVEPQAAPIEVVMLQEAERARPRDLPVKLPEVTVPQISIPLVNIDLPTPPAAITPVAAAPPSPPAPPPVVAGDSDSPVAISEAAWVRMPSPVYPAAARQARAQGVVYVRALVDGSGRAQRALVHRSSGFATLDRAACDSVLAALFRPYLRNGVPRSVDVIVPITFALTMRGGGGRLKLDIRGEDHHAMRGHPEELSRLGAAPLHVGEQPELQISQE
jgi:periplasmic protein TonB